MQNPTVTVMGETVCELRVNGRSSGDQGHAQHAQLAPVEGSPE
jgi:hypothetical protein